MYSIRPSADEIFLSSEALYELVEMHYRRCSEHVSAILEVELTPYTQNTHYLESCKDKWLARYKGTRAGRSEEHASETSSVFILHYSCFLSII